MAAKTTTRQKPDASMLRGFSMAPTTKENAAQETVERPGAAWNKAGYFDVQMKLIEEDPNQPRKEGLSEEELQGLKGTIERHGMIQTISLRTHPDNPEKYMINVGARRFRAYKLLKRKTIPAIFDEKHSKEKQLVENIQRKSMSNTEVIEGLLEMAAKGMSQKDIAGALGKDDKWVSQHLTIAKTKNADIRAAFLSNKINSVTVAKDLNAMAEKSEDAKALISETIAAEPEITSATVKALKNRLTNPERSNKEDAAPEPSGPVIPYTTATAPSNPRDRDTDDEDDDSDDRRVPRAERDEDDEPIPTADPDEPKPPRPQKGKIFMMLNDEEIVILDRMPTTAHRIWIRTQDGREKEVQRSTFPIDIRVAQE